MITLESHTKSHALKIVAHLSFLLTHTQCPGFGEINVQASGYQQGIANIEILSTL